MLLHQGFCAYNPPPLHAMREGKWDLRHIMPQEVSTSALATVAFTSGTSRGLPKGISVTGATRLRQIDSWARSFDTIRASREIGFIFTSLSYEANLETCLSLLFMGGQVGIHTGRVEGMGNLLQEISALRPTYLAAPPAFWTELYNQYCAEKAVLSKQQEQGQGQELELSGTTKDQAEGGEDGGARNVDSRSGEVNMQLSLQELNRKYGSLFGNRLNRVSTGSAHTPEAVFRFMKYIICSGERACILNEGYGAMECGGIATNGKFVWGVRWRLSPVEGYVDTLQYRYGELLVKTSLMSSQYFHNPDLSLERYTSDGFFKTGDLVEIQCTCRESYPATVRDVSELPTNTIRSADLAVSVTVLSALPPCLCDQIEGHRVKVIGRTGSMVKLSDGEFYHPEAVEGKLIECPSVLQIFIHVETSWSCPMAVVVVHVSLLETGQDKAEAVLHSEIHHLVESGSIVNKKHLPLGLVLTDELFTMATGLLTVSSKTCRPKLKQRYLPALTAKYFTLQTALTERTIANILTPLLSVPGNSPAQGCSPREHPGDNLWNAGLNSLSAVALASSVSSAWHIPAEMSLQMVLHSDTIQSLSQQIGCWSSTGKVEVHWKKLLLDDLEWLPKPSSTPTTWGNGDKAAGTTDQCHQGGRQTVLLTGATGFLGSVLLAELLLRSDDARFNVITITRRDQTNNAQDRIFKLLRQHVSSIDVTAITNSDSLLCLEGDLSQPLLGLSAATYFSLVRRVDIIVHCAATTSWTASYTQLRGANVIVTQNILQFMRDGSIAGDDGGSGGGAHPNHPMRLCHISTLSADPFLHDVDTATAPAPDYAAYAASYTQRTRESASRAPDTGHGYPLSKMVAECLVRKCSQYFNFPYVIVRPGTISAHTVTGFSNMTDFTTRLICSIKRSGICPAVECCTGSIDLASVDFVAEVIKLIVTHNQWQGEVGGSTVHVCNDKHTTFSSVLAALTLPRPEQALPPDPPVPPALVCAHVPVEEWVKLIAEDSNDPLHLLSNDVLRVLCSSSSSSSFSSSFSSPHTCTDTATDTDTDPPASLPSASMSAWQLMSCPQHNPNLMIPRVLQWLDASSITHHPEK